MKILLALFCSIIGLLALIHGGEGLSSDSENMENCIQRTGLTKNDIDRFEVRNDKCLIDCITKGSKILTWFAEDGRRCGSSEKNRCLLGVCVGPDDRDNNQDFSDLKNVRIKIKSAHVPDMDIIPTTGESDTFVTVENARTGEMICYTYIIQDNNKPKWSNFVCRPPPMKSKIVLKFSAWDSDKPRGNPELLGSAEITLDELLAAKDKKLSIDPKGKHYINVEVTGETYRRS